MRLSAIRWPHTRVLLGRTRLAYVHLQNLLTDAKRDRAARVFGYVAVWLPDELLLLYMQEGEVVAATSTRTGAAYEDVAIREAVRRVPHAAEYGEVCFHEADDEQLACMHASQVESPAAFPADVRTEKPDALFGHLLASTFDGMLEVASHGAANFIVLRNGLPRRAYLADGIRGGSLERALRDLWPEDGPPPSVRRWPVPPPLPNQAPSALIDAYRALLGGLTERLASEGVSNAGMLVERARELQRGGHAVLEHLTLHVGPPSDPVTTSRELTAAVAAWIKDVLLAAALPDGVTPAKIMSDLTRDRRHAFKTAGLFDALPWKLWG